MSIRYCAAVYVVDTAVLPCRVFLGLHRKEAKWLPVGGKLEPGERPYDGAIREMREELGAEIAFLPVPRLVDNCPSGFLEYLEFKAYSDETMGCFVFVAGLRGPASATRVCSEFVDHGWFDAEGVRRLPAHPRSRHVIPLALRALREVEAVAPRKMASR